MVQFVAYWISAAVLSSCTWPRLSIFNWAPSGALLLGAAAPLICFNNDGVFSLSVSALVA